MGHSCGNSDRTLLNTLFEHKNCLSIKPFYYIKEDGSDNYLEMVQNISRNFTDMKLMRDRVVNKTYCEIHNEYGSSVYLWKNSYRKRFCDREIATTYLVQYFTSLINTIIISPRRWGKSSLVNKAAKLAMAQDGNIRICHIDLFNVRSEEQPECGLLSLWKQAPHDDGSVYRLIQTLL